MSIISDKPKVNIAHKGLQQIFPIFAKKMGVMIRSMAGAIDRFGAKLVEMMLQVAGGKLPAPVSAPAAAPASSGHPDGSAVSSRKGGMPPSRGAAPAEKRHEQNEPNGNVAQASHADSDDEDRDDDRQPPFDPRLPDPALQTRSSLFIKPEPRSHLHRPNRPHKKGRFKKHS